MEIKRTFTTRTDIPASEETAESSQKSAVPQKAINTGIAAMKDGFQASNKSGPMDKAVARAFNPQPPEDPFKVEMLNRPSRDMQAQLISELFAAPAQPVPEDGKLVPIPDDGKLTPVPETASCYQFLMTANLRQFTAKWDQFLTMVNLHQFQTTVNWNQFRTTANFSQFQMTAHLHPFQKMEN